METVLTQRLLNTLQTIDQLNRCGWTVIDGIDIESCVHARWVTPDRKGYHLTELGESVLETGAWLLKLSESNVLQPLSLSAPGPSPMFTFPVGQREPSLRRISAIGA